MRSWSSRSLDHVAQGNRRLATLGYFLVDNAFHRDISSVYCALAFSTAAIWRAVGATSAACIDIAAASSAACTVWKVGGPEVSDWPVKDQVAIRGVRFA